MNDKHKVAILLFSAALTGRSLQQLALSPKAAQAGICCNNQNDCSGIGMMCCKPKGAADCSSGSSGAPPISNYCTLAANCSTT